MTKKLIVKAGYTIEVVSWENDADYYNTRHMTVESLEEAKAIAHMCEHLFASKNNGDGGIGNSFSQNEVISTIIDYFYENPYLTDKKGIDIKDEDNLDYDKLYCWCVHFAGELMGYSEDYAVRVCESATITYSPNDVYLKTIKFD